MKKRISSAIALIFLVNILHSQEIPTLGKLYDISARLGVTFMLSADTMPTPAYQSDFNYPLNERETYLLKAAEFYSKKDYVTTNLYLKKSRINFRNKDLSNLSYVLLIGSYSNLQEIAFAAKYFYIIVRKGQLYPENMELVRAGIRSNFSRSDFDDALSIYFYYHDRQKILRDIYSGGQN
jgi:hypothetical protein